MMNSDDINKILEIFKFEKNKFKNKKILISGSFGFIGKYILDTLISIKKNHHIDFDIYALDNFITSDKKHIDEYKDYNIKCINHDINQELNIDTEFDYIICLAGIASPYYYNKYPLETLNVSINGLMNMFKLKHNINSKFIFFSSSEIYGDPSAENIPTKETYRGNVTTVGPRSCYDESKRVGETICYIQSEKYDKNTTIIRPFNVYGPGMNMNDYRIIPNITRSLLTGEKLKIYDTGEQTRTYCYVVDAINGFLRALINEEKFGIYNIGNDVGEISVLELVKKSEKVIGGSINYEITPYPQEYPADQPQRRCPDLTNAKKNLLYNPTISLEEGLSTHFKSSREAQIKS
jgi:UDP-glucuronate decarboxylase